MIRRYHSRRLAVAAAVAGFACSSDRTVGPGSLSSIGVDPAIALIAVGDSLRVTSWGVSEQNILLIGLPTNWTTSNSTVATVSASGVVHAVAAGMATITAAVEGFTATTAVTVQPPPSIALSTDSVAFTASPGGPDPNPDSVLITNGGGTSLDLLTVDPVTYGAGASGWLVTALTGTTSPSVLSLAASGAGLAQGTYSAIVTVRSVEATNSPQTVTVTLAVRVGAPSLVVAAAGDGQQAAVNTAVPVDPAVRVTDQYGNPVAGVEVTFAVTGGGGALTNATDTTDGTGVARVGSWTLGTAVGANTLIATASPLPANPATFTATAIAGPGAQIAVLAGDGQTAPVVTPVPISPAVLVRDQFGNAATGAAVTFAVTAGGGSVTGPADVADSAGVARVRSWSLGPLAGANQLTATIAGTSTSVAFTATGVPSQAAAMAPLAGDGQTAPVGVDVATPPSVRVTDAFGNTVAGVTVTFAVAAGDGSLTGTTDTTDAAGTAAVGSWTLGSTTGTNALTATAPGLGGSPVTFTATATAGAATQITFAAGNGQSGIVNMPVPVAPAVLVRDQFNNPVPGVEVTFTITAGGGSLTNGIDTTDAGGVAAVGSWTLGTAAGNNTLQATAPGLTGSPVTFVASGTAGAAATIALAAGSGQSAAAGTAVAIAPAAQVRDQFGNGVPGVSVTFAVTGGAGSVAGANAITGPAGIAAVSSWTLGPVPGPNSLTASGAGLTGSPVLYNATGVTGAASAIVLHAGNGQSASGGAAIAVAPAVRVTDQFGNAVAGVAVTFAVTTGGGNLTGDTDTTDATGVAAVGSWTLGTTAGANTLSATSAGLTGSPVTFTATATSGAVAALDITAGDAQSDTVNRAVAVPPAITARDAFGNPVAGVVVTFAVTAGGGATTNTTDTTDATGVAAVGSWTLGTIAGLNTLQAAATGAAPVSFTATGTPDVAATIAGAAGDGQSATVNTAVAVPPAVLVTDQFGNPVTNVTVTFTVTGGGGSVGGGTPGTRSAGSANAGSWTLGTTAGINTLHAASGGLAGSPVAFTATGTADAATQMALDQGNNQTATVNTAVATDPSVLVRDQFLNPVAGMVVTFAVAGGGGSVTGPTDTTDGTGVARVGSWTLGTTAGANSNTLVALSGGLTGSPVAITASATGGAAAQVAVFAGDGESGEVNTAVPIPPAVIVTDQFGNPVGGGVSVTFAVASGGGSITGTNPVVTDAGGVAAIGTWTLGPAAGPNTLTASSSPSLTGSPMTFTATAFAGSAATIALDQGDAQTDTVGATLANAYSVLVTDSLGNPVSGIPVAWAVTGGGGSITPTSLTNASGIAVATRVLGHTAGPQTATAADGGLTGSPVVFTATATHGSATQIAVSAGNNQSATVNNAVAIDPAVIVRDQFNNPVAGASVTFAVTGGGGSATGTTGVTNAAGVAAVASWTLGTTAGANTLQATSAGLTGSPVVFAATGTAGAVTQMTLSAGNGQSATVATSVPIDPAVLLRDQFNNPVAGAAVAFAITGGGGTVTGSPALSNAGGIATAGSWIMDTTAGTKTLRASRGALPAVDFSATATPEAASQIAVSAGNAQTATVNTAVAIDPAVLVRDAFNNPVAGVVITFAVTSGGGSATNATDTTDATGVATVGSWTLGTAAGTGNNTLRATAGGLAPVTFAASATAGPATQLTLQAGDGQSATVNTAVLVDPTVVVRDQFNNRVAGLIVVFAVTGGGGSVTGATDTTDATGVAAVGAWTLGTVAGIANNTLQATATGLTPVTFVASAKAGAPTQMALNAGDAQSATVNTAVAIAPSVLVRDEFNNPVPTVPVAFAVTGGSGVVSGSPAPTNASGIATVGSWTLGTTTGANTLQASVTGPAPVTFAATGTAGPASQIAVSAGDGQSATVNTAVAVAPAVLVSDAFGNGIAGVGVRFVITSGGGSLTGDTLQTNGSGVATLGSWTLGTTAGLNTLRAASAGLTGSPVPFTATGTGGAATQMIISAGNGQSDTVNTAVAIPPAVRLRDQFNNDVPGVIVTFAVTGGGGSVNGAPSVIDTTDAAGIAVVGSWTLGTVAGTNNNTLQATAGALSRNFDASAEAGPVSASQSVVVTSENPITACKVLCSEAANTQARIAVTARDQFNNPVRGATVTVASTGTGHTFSPDPPRNTDAGGLSEVTLTDTVAQAQTISVIAGGVAIAQTLNLIVSHAEADRNTSSLVASDSSITACAVGCVPGPANTATTITATIRDAFNNVVPLAIVEFDANGQGNTFEPSETDTTGPSGAAQRTFHSTRAQNKTISATVDGGLIRVRETVRIDVNPAAATTVVINAGNTQAARAGAAVGTDPSVLVRDEFLNPVRGQPVTFAILEGGGVLSGGSAVTDTSGIARVTSWILSVTGTEGAEGSGTFAGQFTNRLRATVVGVDTVEFMAHAFYTFGLDAAPILSGCNGCHYPGPQNWTTHVNTFNVNQQDPAGFTACTLANSVAKLVDPDHASRSLIYLKTNGAADPDPTAHPCPAPSIVMPSGSGLTTAQRTILRAWINDGALNN